MGKKRSIAFKDGSPVCVLRPDDARAAVNAALRALNTGNAAEMKPKSPEGLTFVGWLSQDGCVIDGAGKVCAVLKPGDHMVTFDTPEEMAAAFDVKLKS